MINCYPFITPYPKHLHDSNLAANMREIDVVSRKVQQVCFAWGNFKEAERTKQYMKNKFPNAMALHINKNGSPKHPLYCKKDSVLIPFKP